MRRAEAMIKVAQTQLVRTRQALSHFDLLGHFAAALGLGAVYWKILLALRAFVRLVTIALRPAFGSCWYRDCRRSLTSCKRFLQFAQASYRASTSTTAEI